MSPHLLRRTSLLVPLLLTSLVGCTETETTAPRLASKPHFAQGDGGVWTVNSLADPGDGVCDDTSCTLREAIEAAAAGGQVVIASGLQGTVTLTVGTLLVQRGISVDGGGRITVDAQGSSRVMTVTVGSSVPPVSISGFTFKNAHSSTVGGALAVSGAASLTVQNTVISGSKADEDGGGVWIDSNASLTLINSTVSGNTAVQGGGGIYNRGKLTLRKSTVSSNVAAEAGGIYGVTGTQTTVEQSTISGNDARAMLSGAHGGGIVSAGSLELRSATITKNTQGGVVLRGATIAVQNSIIGGNGYSCDAFAAVFTSGGYNLVTTGGGAGCTFNGPGDIALASAQLFTDVLDQELKDNGGPTMTHALIARGRAVDAGSCPSETTDQRGFPRRIDEPTVPNVKDACDIGAYEAGLPPTADLIISQSVDKTSVKQGDLLTYTVRVRNLGPETSPNVVVSDVLSSGVTFVEIRTNKGTTTAPPKGETGTVTWSLGDLLDQANETAEIKVTVLVRGKTTITNTATVAGDVPDPNSANNSASITVSVASGSGGGSKKG